jgi:hypothetical protein
LSKFLKSIPLSSISGPAKFEQRSKQLADSARKVIQKVDGLLKVIGIPHKCGQKSVIIAIFKKAA